MPEGKNGSPIRHWSIQSRSGASESPLVQEEYSDNPMLNILLADRKQTAESRGIRFVVKVESTGLGFIEPVDVTTLFGNLLKNAMQAVLMCSGAWRNMGQRPL